MKKTTKQDEKSTNTGFDGKTTHYTCKAGYDADKVIEDFELNFRLGNAVKYILRFGKKGSKDDYIRDLEKAIAYISKELTHIKEQYSDEKEKR